MGIDGLGNMAVGALRAIWNAGSTYKMIKNANPSASELKDKLLRHKVSGKDFYSMVPFSIKGK
jgi:hypothetical protein